MKYFLILLILTIATISYAEEPQPTAEELTTQSGQLMSQSVLLLGKLQLLEEMIDDLYAKKQTLKAQRNNLIQQIQAIQKQQEKNDDKPVQK